MNFHRSAGARAAALLLSAAMLFTPALAASNGVVTAESGLHVRQASSADSASLGLLEKGTTVEILSDLGNGWLEISYQAAAGFVSGEYVEPPHRAPRQPAACSGTGSGSGRSVRPPRP